MTKKVTKNRFLQIVCFIAMFPITIFCQWEQTNFPIGFPVQDFIVHKNQLHPLIGYTLTKTLDKGETYEVLITGHGAISAVISNDTNLYAGSLSIYPNFGMLHSNDNGSSWDKINSGIPDISRVSDILCFDTFIIFTSFSGSFLSSNKGDTWNQISFPRASGGRGNYFSVEKSLNKIFIGGNNGLVFHSSDNGQSWNSSRVNSHFDVVSLYYFEECIYAGTSGTGIYRSCDEGNSWEEINDGLQNAQNIRHITKLKDNQLVSVTGGDIYLWKQNKQIWELLDNPPFEVNKIIFFDGYYYAGAFDNGIWRKKASEEIGLSIIPTLSDWGKFIYILLILNIIIGVLSVKENKSFIQDYKDSQN